MDWKDVATAVAKYAPLAGTLLGNPIAGSLVGGLVSSAMGVDNTPDAVNVALATNPEAAVKLRQMEVDKQVDLAKLQNALAIAEVQAQAQNTSDVNKTMQAEAAAPHWVTYSWRPILGFCVGFNTAAASLLVMLSFGAMFSPAAVAVAATLVAQLPAVLGALAVINGTVLPILGIASWHRGRMQVVQAEKVG